jgi:dienelactone hydrolase
MAFDLLHQLMDMAVKHGDRAEPLEKSECAGRIFRLLPSRGLDNSCLALVGFSQGAATALYAGLHRQKRIAGVVAFSGALSGAAHLLGEIASKPPLVHGEEDNVVPFQSMANAKSALEAAGVKVRAVAGPGLGHAIDGAGDRTGRRFSERGARIPPCRRRPAGLELLSESAEPEKQAPLCPDSVI